MSGRYTELVARRFMATLADPATARSTRVDIDIDSGAVRRKGDVIVTGSSLLPVLAQEGRGAASFAEGDRLKVVNKELEARQTQPPARHTRAGSSRRWRR
jgi:DNA topoisomerase IA